MAGIETQHVLTPAQAQEKFDTLSQHNVALADQAERLEEEKLALQRKVNELEDQLRDDAERHLKELEGFEDKIDALEKRLKALEAALKRQ